MTEDSPEFPAAPALPPAPVEPGYVSYHVDSPYAGWWQRVGAALLDALIAFGVIIVPVIISMILLIGGMETDPVTGDVTDVEPMGVVGIVAMVLTVLFYIGFIIWNMIYKVGKYGQSIGRSVVGIKVVKADDGSVPGQGIAWGRFLIYQLMGMCYISILSVLWPLWDDRNQTLHDKVVSTVVIKVS